MLGEIEVKLTKIQLPEEDVDDKCNNDKCCNNATNNSHNETYRNKSMIYFRLFINGNMPIRWQKCQV